MFVRGLIKYLVQNTLRKRRRWASQTSSTLNKLKKFLLITLPSGVAALERDKTQRNKNKTLVAYLTVIFFFSHPHQKKPREKGKMAVAARVRSIFVV